MKMTKLSSEQIKAVAIATMLIDHIAVCFLNSMGLYFFFRLIGKITIPVMCYFIAEGFYKTSNLKRYSARLLLFAVISHMPFYYFLTGIMPQTFNELMASLERTSVLWPLFLGLVALTIQKSDILCIVKYGLILILASISIFGDWRFYAVIWILIFGVFRESKFKQFFYFSLATLPSILSPLITGYISGGNYYPTLYYQIGLLLPVPLLLQYDESRSKSVVLKLAFYLFYPVHLLILSYLRQRVY